MSEEEFNSRLKKIKDKNIAKKRKARLKAEKEKYKQKFKLPSTSKLVLLAVFLLCIEIVIFCEYAMIVLADTSAMYVLIGIPTTLVPTVISYYNKAKAENTASGIVYEKAMRDLNHINANCDESNDVDSEEAQG